jgi:hypothetical protein
MQAPARQSAAAGMTFHLGTHKHQPVFLPSAKEVSFAQMKGQTASLCSQSAVPVNLTVMVSMVVHIFVLLILPFFRDQCEAPPNFKQLVDDSGRGLNFNGSVCLNNVCM